MTREELIGINAGIVQTRRQEHSGTLTKRAIFIVVSNPMDTMTYLTHKALGLAKKSHHRHGWGPG